tara:strand:- start:128 stop:694 length:567 start_codon:yes stop_codon:yes gene_type:complete
MYSKTTKVTLIIISIIIVSLIFFQIINKKDVKIEKIISEEKSYSSNIIENVEYSSKDVRGNEYLITAKEGEIDINDNSIIFLTNVNAIVNLSNSNKVLISSNFGKYNINNFDTIFNKNVIIKYLSNNIKGDYLDFSIARNSMIISQNVIYSNNNSILKTDIIEIDLRTKNTKFFMYNKKNKVRLKSIN